MLHRVLRCTVPVVLWGSCLGSLPACASSRGTIGVVMVQDAQGRLVIREVPRGLAASRAGVRVGDELLLIEGRDVRRLTPSQVHLALGGEIDQPVKLTLVREHREIIRVTLHRTSARRRGKAQRPDRTEQDSPGS